MFCIYAGYVFIYILLHLLLEKIGLPPSTYGGSSFQLSLTFIQHFSQMGGVFLSFKKNTAFVPKQKTDGTKTVFIFLF